MTSQYEDIAESMIVQLYERVKYINDGKKYHFSPSEKMTIKMSWNTWLAGDPSQRGFEMFLKMFANQPDTQKVFHFAQGSSSEQMQASSALIFHVTRVIKHINMAIDNLDNLEDIVPIYKRLGQRHGPQAGGYNVPKSYFPFLGVAMRELMAAKLKDGWTARHEALWTNLFTFIIDQIRDGIDQAAAKMDKA